MEFISDDASHHHPGGIVASGWNSGDASPSSEPRQRDVYVYCVTTLRQVELIVRGFRDEYFDTDGRGIMVQLAAPGVRSKTLR